MPTRARFIGAAAAASLAGCAGRAGSPFVPVAHGAAAGAVTGALDDGETRLSANSLARPIIGEVGTFAGTVVPSGWMLARGQTLRIDENRPLFSILGTSSGGDGKTTFTLPNFRASSWVVAVAGTYPSSPKVLAAARPYSLAASLGAGAHLAAVAAAKPPSPELVADRALANASRVVPSRAGAIDRAALARIADASAQARTAAFAALAPSNAALARTAVAAAVAGRGSVADLARGLGASLSPGEANALLAIYDASAAVFRDGGTAAHVDLRAEAARAFVAVAFTPDEVETMTEREFAQP